VALENALDRLVAACERVLAEVPGRLAPEVAKYLIESADVGRRYAANPKYHQN
jgi:hypothetical protein